ncbi:hypothetical protein C8F01DRAFT_1246314 [Mycena amicta]|nr:hypothetical protein C8F01DRAFT_1246314 [Mycena amicta]
MKCMVPLPKALQGSQQFSKEHYEDLVLPEVHRFREEQQQKNGGAELPRIKVNDRAATARRLFAKLDQAEKKAYEQRAAEFAAREKAAFDTMAEAGYPKDPTWRDSAIADIQLVLAPVLRQIHEITGYQIICGLGGPLHGRNDISNDPFKVTIISVGTNRAPSPVSFANYHPRQFEEFTTLFKQYLATCYDESDIQSYQIPPGHTLQSLTEEPIDVLAAAQYRIEPDDGEDDDDDGSVTTQSDLANDERNDSTDDDDSTHTGKKRPRAASTAAMNSVAKRPKQQVANPADRRRQEAIAAQQRERDAREAAETRKQEAEERNRQHIISEGAALIAAARSPEGLAKAAAELEKKREKEMQEDAARSERMRRARTREKDIGGPSDVEMSLAGASDVEMAQPGVSSGGSDLDMPEDAHEGTATTDEDVGLVPGEDGPPTTDNDLRFPLPDNNNNNDDQVLLEYDDDHLPLDYDDDPLQPPNVLDTKLRSRATGTDDGDEDGDKDGDKDGEDGDDGDDEALLPPKEKGKAVKGKGKADALAAAKPTGWRTQRTEPASSGPRRGRSATAPRRGRSPAGSSAPEAVTIRPKPRPRKKT